MYKDKERLAAAIGRRHSKRSEHAGREARQKGTRLIASLAALAAAGAALVIAPSAIGVSQAQRLLQISGAQRTISVTVAVGKTEDVRIDNAFTEISVGDPEVADVKALTDHMVSILGRKVGTTRVTIYGEGNRPLGIFDIEVSYDVSRLATEIRAVTGNGIRVSSVNGRIMLSGTATDALTLDKAIQIARQFAPDLINTVQVSQPQQVMLEVRFVEASREAGRELGVQWNIFSSKATANIGSGKQPGQLPIPAPSGASFVNAAETAAGVLSGGSPFGFVLGRILSGGTKIDVLINALEQRGLARSLAEPNLVALSGDTASFLAGGEYPIPVAGSFQQVTVEYKRYGVGLAFTPTVLKDGLINIKIEPEVSQFDPNHTVSLGNGLSVPALIVRRASTTVELRDGQSFVIGGLLQNTSTANQQQLPWLGDVPVLGQLFASRSYLKNETDLAIIVTPRLVRPARPGDPVKTPLDKTLPANDPDFFLLGKAEITPTDARLALSHQNKLVGHILDLPKKGGVNVVAAKN